MKSSYKIFTLFFLISSLFACGGKNQNEEQNNQHAHAEQQPGKNEVVLTPEQYQTAGIQIGKMQERALSGTIIVNGLLDLPPQSKVSISSPFIGMLKSTNMLQGKKVKKGELVGVLEHPDYLEVQQNYLELKSQLNYQKEEYERQQLLAKEEVNAKKSLQKAESDYRVLKSKFEATKSKLKLMNIGIANLEKGNLVSTINLYSPIAGYVTAVNTNIGAMVSPNDVLFEIADTEHLHAELTVYEKDIPKLKIGQKVRFTLANETKDRMATVYLIGRKISAERTVNIHCHLDIEDAQLLPGMYLTALVESGASKVASLPNAAIVDFEGEKYIFFASENKKNNAKEHHFEVVKVNLGVSELGYTQINIAAIKDWDQKNVVLKGAYDLLSQLKNTEEEGEGHGH